MPADNTSAISVLTYHSLDASGSVVSVTPQTFADQMACLAEGGFRGITLREALSHRAATGSWPARGVVLTFDDGYANIRDVALPVLLRHGFGATLFLVTGHVGGSNDWGPPPARLGTCPMLSWKQVAECAAGGMEIAAHTRTHPDLVTLSPAAMADEVAGSRGDIERHVQQVVESFAYPFGRVNAAVETVVRRDFRAACTTVLRRARDDLWTRLPRIDAYYLRSPHVLCRLLDGSLDQYLTVRRWGRVLRQVGKRLG